MVTPLLLPFACFTQSWTSELVPRSCLFSIITFVTKGDFDFNQTFWDAGSAARAPIQIQNGRPFWHILAHSSPFRHFRDMEVPQNTCDSRTFTATDKSLYNIK